MPFSALSPEEQTAFRKRLKRLDVDESAIIADELVVPQGTTMHLSPSPEGGGEPRRLITRDLDVLRRWVGTPQQLEDNRRVSDVARRLSRFPGLAARIEVPERPARITARAGTGAPVTLPELLQVSPAQVEDAVRRTVAARGSSRPGVRPSTLELETLRAAAHMYVHGNKAAAAPFKSAVEAFFGNFEIFGWLYTEIRVKKNSTLTFGAGANVAAAHRVVLEPGARIRSFGHLKVDCSILRKEKTTIVLPPHVRPTDLRITPRRPHIP